MQIDKTDVLKLMENFEATQSCGGFSVEYHDGRIKHVHTEDSAKTQEEMGRLMRPRS